VPVLNLHLIIPMRSLLLHLHFQHLADLALICYARVALIVQFLFSQHLAVPLDLAPLVSTYVRRQIVNVILLACQRLVRAHIRAGLSDCVQKRVRLVVVNGRGKLLLVAGRLIDWGVVWCPLA
jgi:hypothetical protein